MSAHAVHVNLIYDSITEVRRVTGADMRIKPSGEAEAPKFMKFRFASINDLPIKESERKFRWDR